MKFVLIVLLLSFSTQLLGKSNFIYSPKARTLKKREMRAWNSTRMFETEATWDANGNERQFVEGESFRILENRTTFSYGLSHRFQFNLGGNFRKIDATAVDANNNSYELSTSGVESYFGGVKYYLGHKNQWTFALEGTASKTAFTNPVYDASRPYDFIVLGDENQAVSAIFHMGFQSSSLQFFEMSAGYVYNSDLSAEIVYNVQAAMTGSYFALVVGVNGVQTMGGDSYSDNPALKPEIGTANTELFNSVDRTYTDGFAKLNISPGEHWRVEVGAAYRATGISTDKGRTLFVNLIGQTKGESQRENIIKDFKNYNIEANVVKISPRGKFIKIDAGLGQGVEKGMKVDFYQIDFKGGNILLASGAVFEARSDESIVKIQKRYSRIALRAGHVARIAQ